MSPSSSRHSIHPSFSNHSLLPSHSFSNLSPSPHPRSTRPSLSSNLIPIPSSQSLLPKTKTKTKTKTKPKPSSSLHSISSPSILPPSTIKPPSNLKKITPPPNPNPHSTSHQPIPSSRPKRLINIKEKNQRILASINATLSPPTSPSQPRKPDPPLPPPPPSNSDSSSDSSTSSSSSQPPIHSLLPSTLLPKASLNAFAHHPKNPPQLANSLSIPTPSNSSSGLIPFAKDCSPSPRKITNTTHIPPSAPLANQPAMAPLESLDLLAQAAEDDRLGSVRGKRPERCRLLRRSSPGDNELPTPTPIQKSLPPNPSLRDQSLILQSATLQDLKSGKPNSTFSTSHRPPCRPESYRASHQSSSSASHPTNEPKIRRTEGKSAAIRHSTHARHSSNTISMDTSSSDTIGKTDNPTHPRGSFPPPSDPSQAQWSDQLRPNAVMSQKDWAHLSSHEQEDQADRDQDDMSTPVKARAQPAFSLRHATSVSELMISTAHLALPGPTGPALTPRASLGHRRSSSADRAHPRPTNDHLVTADRPSAPSVPQISTRPVMHRDNGANSCSPSLSDHQLLHHSIASLPTTPTNLCPSSSRSNHLSLPLRPQSTFRHKLITHNSVCSSPDSSTSSSSQSTHPHTHNRPRPISSSSNLNPKTQTNNPLSQTNDHFPSSKPLPPSTLPSFNHSHTNSDDRDLLSSSKLNSLSSHPPQLSNNSNHPARTTSSISGSIMLTNGNHPRSPAQSHAGSSTRRHRPGLPQHFIQSVPSSEYPDSRAPSRAEARRAAEQVLSSPRSSRTGPPPPTSPHRHLRSGQRYSDTYTLAHNRPLVVESALAHYDGHHTYTGPRAQNHQAPRVKHSTWSSVLDDGVGGEVVRSQSVLAGVYDPRSIGVRRLRNNTHNSRSPTTARYNTTYHPADEDDDGQTSMTTYVHSHSLARKMGSNGSWEFEDHEPRRVIRTESRLSRRRTADLASGLVSTPVRHRSSLEHDRTVRGSGGARTTGGRPLTHVLVRSPQDHRHTPGQPGDQVSSTSSGASSRRLPGSLHRAGHPSGSALGSRRETRHAPDSAVRQSQLSIRPDSAVSIGVAGVLSPTPDVDYHKLLISAYEALERGQEDDLGDGHRTLVGLLASVVKNSCRIDATLGQLAEASVAAQVEMELMDDEEAEGWEAQRAGGVWRQRYERVESSLGRIEKVQAQLVRTSNDHIRDLTEVLIWLNTLERSRQRGEMGVDEGPGWSRASGRYSSSSHSPSKARVPMGASPLSVISSHDESPLARAKPQQGSHDGSQSRVEQPQRASTISFTNERPVSMGRVHQRLRAKHRLSGGAKTGGNGSGSLVTSMSSMSLVSQTVGKQEQEREDARDTVDEFGQMIRRRGTERRMRSAGGGSGQQSVAGGEANGRTRRHEQSNWTTSEMYGGGGKTIRGGPGSSLVFPRTPPRLATASLSHMTAHSNVSPTKAGERQGMESRAGWREREEAGRMVRPQSSMSVILDRANHVLSRVGYYPESLQSPQPQSARRSGFGGRERFGSGASAEDGRRGGGRRSICASRGGERSETEGGDEVERRGGRDWESLAGRGATAATAALERLSQMGSWHGRPPRLRSEEEQEEEEEWRRRGGERRRTARGSVSTYVVGGTESEVDGDQEYDDDDEDDTCQAQVQRGVYRRPGANVGGLTRGMNGNGSGVNGGGKLGMGKRTGSIQKLFGGMRRG